MRVHPTRATLNDTQQPLVTTHVHGEGMALVARRVAVEMLQNKTDCILPKRHGSISS